MKNSQKQKDVIIMLDKKRGVEMGMNVIVVAVIALAVLIVVLIVFAGKFSLLSGELNKCVSTGHGRCVSGETECTDKWGGRIVDFKCSSKDSKDKSTDNKCCISPCTMAGGYCISSSCSEANTKFADCGDGHVCCKKEK